MNAAMFSIIALPIVVALTLRFTSWAERAVLQEDQDSNRAHTSSNRENAA